MLPTIREETLLKLAQDMFAELWVHGNHNDKGIEFRRRLFMLEEDMNPPSWGGGDDPSRPGVAIITYNGITVAWTAPSVVCDGYCWSARLDGKKVTEPVDWPWMKCAGRADTQVAAMNAAVSWVKEKLMEGKKVG